MSNQRTHYVTTTDGVTIGGTVHGEGPPLVFVHGMVADGDTDWQALLPHLTGRFDLPPAEPAGPWPQRRSPRPQPRSDG